MGKTLEEVREIVQKELERMEQHSSHEGSQRLSRRSAGQLHGQVEMGLHKVMEAVNRITSTLESAPQDSHGCRLVQYAGDSLTRRYDRLKATA